MTSDAQAVPDGGLARRFVRSGHPLARLVRFGIVGVTSGAVYALVTTFLISYLGLSPVIASVLGYCISVPTSFLGHRQYSFRSRGRWTAEALRFVVTQALNITVTAGAMYVATVYLGAHYGWGMLAAVVLLPIANFMIMNLWVFRDQVVRRPI